MALLRIAVETEQVAFSPGEVYASRQGGHARHCLRLSFANSTPPRLEEGIRRLGRVIRAAMALPRPGEIGQKAEFLGPKP